ILVLHIRKGRVLGKRPYILDINNKVTTNNEILPVFLEQYYTDKSTFIPDQIVVEKISTDLELVKRILEEIHPKLTIIKPPPNSRDEGMLKIAQKNVGLILGQRRLLAEQASAKMKQMYEDLRDMIPGLNQSPIYIEAFDISNTQGSNPTASMVVFRNGTPAPQEYRRYRIRLKQTPDDVGMMKEVVGRRYSRLLRETKPFPDLILVDGGKGQLNGAVDTLQNLNIQDQPIIGLAKQEEQVYVPGQSDPISLDPSSTASRVFQAIRDEAHRFAVTYHRLLRQKAETTSDLETIPGVGPKRHKQLLATFGSIEGIKHASLDELKTVLPSSIAQTVFNAISSQNNKPEKKKFKVWLPKNPST
ncbi:MAG: excinuclease ABC subunit C, partial [Promethearchaeota archaeon CR_4]